MDFRDAVDLLRANDRQMRHADILAMVFIEDAHPADAIRVARIHGTDKPQEAEVDFADDLDMARQQFPHQIKPPCLQRFRKNRMVRVADARRRDPPCVVPFHLVLVHQDTHKFGNHERRMRVVQLHEDFLRQRIQRIFTNHVATQNVLQRAGDEEVLLTQAKLFALLRVVVRIQDLRQRLRLHLVHDGANVFAAVEILQVDFVVSLCGPKAKRVDRLAAVTDHGNVIRNAAHMLVRLPPPDFTAVFTQNYLPAAELDMDLVLRTHDLPWIADADPVVGLFHLFAFFQPLAEDAEIVAQSIAVARQAHRRHGIHETCGETAETAVSEPCVGFACAKILPLHPLLLQRRLAGVLQAEIDDVVRDETPNQIFQRKIIDFAGIRVMARFQPPTPPQDDLVTDGV